MPGVEDNPAPAGCTDVVVDLPLVVEQGDMGGVEVGVDITRAHVLEQFLIGAGGLRGEVDHGDGVAAPGRLQCAASRFPPRTAKMGRFGPDHVLAVLHDGGSAGDGVHLADILLRGSGHAGADDIDKGEYAGLRGVYYGALEVGEILPTRPAGIDDRGHAIGQGVLVGEEPAAITAVGVHVDVDEARCDIEASSVDFPVGGARDFVIDGRDQPVFDGDSGGAVPLVFGVDEVAVAHDDIEVAAHDALSMAAGKANG